MSFSFFLFFLKGFLSRTWFEKGVKTCWNWDKRLLAKDARFETVFAKRIDEFLAKEKGKRPLLFNQINKDVPILNLRENLRSGIPSVISKAVAITKSIEKNWICKTRILNFPSQSKQKAPWLSCFPISSWIKPTREEDEFYKKNPSKNHLRTC